MTLKSLLPFFLEHLVFYMEMTLKLPTNILYNASILLLNEKRSKEIESFSFHTFDNDVFCPVFCLEFVHLNKLGLSTKQTL